MFATPALFCLASGLLSLTLPPDLAIRRPDGKDVPGHGDADGPSPDVPNGARWTAGEALTGRPGRRQPAKPAGKPAGPGPGPAATPSTWILARRRRCHPPLQSVPSRRRAPRWRPASDL
jgi:hypothetical protein